MAISILTGTPGTPGTDNGGTASVSFVIPSTVPDGSLIVAIHDNDYRDYTNMVAPTLSFGSPTMNFLGGNDGGSLLSHIKVWAFDYPVGATGTARTLTCTETGTHDGDKGLSVYALSGAAAAASCLDGSLVATGSPSTSQSTHVLTGVTTSQAGSLLLGHIRTSNGAGGVTFTAPGSMTERYDVNNFTCFTGATEVLAGAGATGTRTFTPSGSVPWVGVLFAIAAASAGTAPTWIPIPRVRRPVPPPRRMLGRVAAPVRAQVNPPYPTAFDAQPRRLKAAPVRRQRIVSPVPAQAAVAAPAYPPQPERLRLKAAYALRRNRVAAPVPDQIVLIPPAYPPQPERARLKAAILHRNRFVGPVPAQVILTAPSYPPQPERIRLRLARLFRGRTAGPVPPQIVPTAPAYPPQPERARIRGLRLFRPRLAGPVAAQAAPPPQIDPRPRLRLRPVRGHLAAPPVPQAVPPAAFARPRVRVVRLFRGRARMPVPPQIIVIPPEKATQAVRARRAQMAARRHRGGVEGWMVGGSHLCVITRPTTGTTGRGAGATGRPDTGITEEPC